MAERWLWLSYKKNEHSLKEHTEFMFFFFRERTSVFSVVWEIFVSCRVETWFSYVFIWKLNMAKGVYMDAKLMTDGLWFFLKLCQFS